MLTKRTLLLTATGLLLGYVAAGQSTAAAPAAGPTPTDILSWLTWGAAAVVLLMTIITAAALAQASQRRAAAEAPAEAEPAAVHAETALAAPAPVASPVTAEPVLA